MNSLVYHYSNAFFDLAKENKNISIYLDDARIILQVLKENEELIKLLSSYFLDENEKNDIIDKVFASLNEQNSRNLIKLVTANHLVSSLDEIIVDFIELCNAELGVKKGTIYSTKALNKDEIESIEKAFKTKVNIKVELENVVDTSLIGGVRVVIGDRIYDGSLKNKIESLKSSLKREGAN